MTIEQNFWRIVSFMIGSKKLLLRLVGIRRMSGIKYMYVKNTRKCQYGTLSIYHFIIITGSL